MDLVDVSAAYMYIKGGPLTSGIISWWPQLCTETAGPEHLENAARLLVGGYLSLCVRAPYVPADRGHNRIRLAHMRPGGQAHPVQSHVPAGELEVLA